jgi:hypothetical protein
MPAPVYGIWMLPRSIDRHMTVGAAVVGMALHFAAHRTMFAYDYRRVQFTGHDPSDGMSGNLTKD